MMIYGDIYIYIYIYMIGMMMMTTMMMMLMMIRHLMDFINHLQLRGADLSLLGVKKSILFDT